MGSWVWSLLACLSRAVAALSGALLLLLEHAHAAEQLCELQRCVQQALLTVGQLGGSFGGAVLDMLTLAREYIFFLSPVPSRAALL